MMSSIAWCCPTDWETRFLLLVYLKNVLMGRALLRYSIEKLYIEIKNPYAGEGAVRDGLPASNREGHGHGCRSR